MLAWSRERRSEAAAAAQSIARSSRSVHRQFGLLVRTLEQSMVPLKLHTGKNLDRQGQTTAAPGLRL